MSRWKRVSTTKIKLMSFNDIWVNENEQNLYINDIDVDSWYDESFESNYFSSNLNKHNIIKSTNVFLKIRWLYTI